MYILRSKSVLGDRKQLQKCNYMYKAFRLGIQPGKIYIWLLKNIEF